MKQKKQDVKATEPESPPKKTRKKTFGFFAVIKRFFYTLFFLILGSGFSLILIGCGFLMWVQSILPGVDQFNTKVRTPSVTVQAFDGTVIASYGDLYDDFIPVSDLPPYVPNAFLAVEDKRFYVHNGIDVLGLIRAAFINYSAHRVVQGGSTLTQQLAKNILTSNGMFSVNDRSLKRKIVEFMLAIRLEEFFSKEEILTMYLNRVYFGAGTYGIDAASRRYFQKSAKDLSLFEAAVLAGLLRAPSRYSPSANPSRAISRAQIVLERMEVNQMLSPKWRSFMEQWKTEFLTQSVQSEKGSRYFADWVYESIPSVLGPLDQDITVVTTLNMEMQRVAEQTCKKFYDANHEEYKFSQAALVAMTTEGAILSMVGGLDYGVSQFNRVTSAMRQPGSAFKPFVYLTAVESGITPDTLIDDSPYKQGTWKPANYKWTPRGTLPMMEGFVHSVNSVCIRLARMVGIRNVAKTARRLGIYSPLDINLTLALGTSSLTLLELVGAYGPFANSGNAVWPYGIQEIRNRNGDILFQHQPIQNIKVIADAPRKTMNTMMRAVVARGTSRAANVDPYLFGKTGTSGHSDAWVVLAREPQTTSEATDEMSPRYLIDQNGLVLGIWVGNDAIDQRMVSYSTGGRIPGRMAAEMLKTFLAVPKPTKNTPPPPEKKIDKPITIDQLFVPDAGTEIFNDISADDSSTSSEAANDPPPVFQIETLGPPVKTLTS